MRARQQLTVTAKTQLLMRAAAQCGLVAAGQAGLISGGPNALRRLVREGALVADRGVYRLAEQPITPETRLWAAVLATGGTLSHTTAATRWGARLKASAIEVTLPISHRRQRRDGITVHRSRRLPAHHVTTDPDGLPLTNAPRTMVDLAALATVTDDQLRTALDDLIVARVLTLGWLQWFLREEATGLNGRRRLSPLIATLTDPRADSVAERQLARLLRRAELSGFVTQLELTTAAARYRLDFAWPGHKVALELDGYRFHSAPGTFVADRRRGNEIELAGWHLLRTTPQQVREHPDEVVATVRRALDQHR